MFHMSDTIAKAEQGSASADRKGSRWYVLEIEMVASQDLLLSYCP